jgi:thiol-disulfide isomerase/thioredoxin
MFSAIKGIFSKNNKEETNSVRSPDDISAFNDLIKKGPKTFVLIHADWCGPCQMYKPMWKKLTSTPGRVANMAMVHHDMVDNIDVLKKAKIPGYPSVIKVFPDGHIQEYKDSTKKSTNSMPNMRDIGSMVTELKTLSPKEHKSHVIKPTSNINIKTATKNRNILDKSRKRATKRSLKTTSLLKPPFTSSPVRPSFQQPVSSSPALPSFQQPIASSPVRPSFQQPISSSPVRPSFQQPFSRNQTSNVIQKGINMTPVHQRNNMYENMPRTALNSVQMKPLMKGGLYTALSSALMKAAPASFLFGVSQMLPTKKTRGSTMRLTRKSRLRR